MLGSLIKECLDLSFDALEDPKMDRSEKNPLQEILYLAILAALQCIVELLGNERSDSPRGFYLHRGNLTHQAVGRFFSILNPKSFDLFL